MRTHTGEKPFICKQRGCKRAFASLANCKRHERTHKNERRYKCLPCKLPFTQSNDLKRHLNSISHQETVAEQSLTTIAAAALANSAPSPSAAPYATSSSSSAPAMSAAIASARGAGAGQAKSIVGKKVAQPECIICRKIFRDKYAFNMHMRIHRGEKPYACKHCPKSFAQEGNRTAHERTHMKSKSHQEQVAKQSLLASAAAAIVNSTSSSSATPSAISSSSSASAMPTAPASVSGAGAGSKGEAEKTTRNKKRSASAQDDWDADKRRKLNVLDRT